MTGFISNSSQLRYPSLERLSGLASRASSSLGPKLEAVQHLLEQPNSDLDVQQKLSVLDFIVEAMFQIKRDGPKYPFEGNSFERLASNFIEHLTQLTNKAGRS